MQNGDKHEHGVDFDDIFSPVVKKTALRTISGLFAAIDMELIQMNVTTAFYMAICMKTSICSSLKGFVAKGKKKMVCKLIRSLYGLKQVSQEWYYEFDTFTQSQGFCRSQVESLLVHQKGSLIILVLYIDMLIAGRDTHAFR